MKNYNMIIVLIIVVLFCNFSNAQEQVFPEIRVTGKGVSPAHIKNPAQAKILAERAAKLDALKNLLARLGKIVNEQQGGKFTQRVQGIINGYYYGKINIAQDGIVTAEVILPLPNLLRNYYRTQQQLEENITQTNNLRQKNIEQDKHIALLAQAKKELQHKTKVLTVENKQLQKQKIELKSLLTKKEQISHKLNLLLQEREIKLTRYLKAFQETRKELEKRNNTVKKQLQKITQQDTILKEKEQAISLALSKLQKAQQKLKTYTSELLKKEKALQTQQQAQDAKQKLLQKKDIQLKNLQAKIGKIVKSLMEKEQELGQSLILLKKREKLLQQSTAPVKIDNKTIEQLRKKIGMQSAQLEKRENMLTALQASHKQQQNALIAFEKEYKKLKTTKIQQQQKYEILLKELKRLSKQKIKQQTFAERQIRELQQQYKQQHFKNLKLQKEARAAYTKMKASDLKLRLLGQKQKQQLENFHKMIDLLSRINNELTALWLKYQKLSKLFNSNRVKLAQAQERGNYLYKNLQQTQQLASEWRNRYYDLWAAYKKLSDKNGKQKKEQSALLENILREIYVSQKVLLNKLNLILKRMHD